MAIVLDGWAVIARRSAIEAKLTGGVAGWFEVVPNGRACVDRDLCSVAFMAREDAAAFVLKLVAMGLEGERDGAYRDVALVEKDGPWEHAGPWLAVGRYAGVHAIWMEGADREPLVVPATWQPDNILNLTAEEAARRLRFVRRDGDVEVWLDTETGKQVYRGRTGPRHGMEPDIEQRFQDATAVLTPVLTVGAPPRKLGWFERRRLLKGIRALEAIASGDRWRVWFLLGLARRAAADDEGAFQAFERAYAIHPAQPDVSREFGGQCLALGRGDQAVAACEQNCSLHPRDAGLRSNLALAYVIAGNLDRAKVEVTRALALDPADAITRGLAKMIDDVIAGKMPRPTKHP